MIIQVTAEAERVFRLFSLRDKWNGNLQSQVENYMIRKLVLLKTTERFSVQALMLSDFINICLEITVFCRLIVVLRNQVHIFSFPNNPKKICTFETRDNPRGELV
jgi:hypothetical protein